MDTRPVIGITAALESAHPRSRHDALPILWEDVEGNVSQRTYSLTVGDAGAIPLILPADDTSAADADQLLDLLDGLVLAGGADIDPATYGAERDSATGGFRAERDRFELALARGALDRDLPLLGVCRGALAARAVGAERVAVRSHHHQGVDRLGAGLAASGWAEPGGLVEAVEIPDLRFALGVLWHPEEDRRNPVIAALTEATRAQRVAA